MPNLLIVEDNEQHMNWLLNLLEKRGSILGYQIKCHTKNWKRALNLLREQPDEIDVVITDLQDGKTMKFIGFDIIKEARKSGKRVIAVSSFLDDEAHMRDVLRSGADFHVKKPFKPQWRKMGFKKAHIACPLLCSSRGTSGIDKKTSMLQTRD